MKNSTKRLLVVLFAVFCIAPLALAQAPAAAPAMATPAASAAVPPPPAPKPILDADLASTPVPSADAHAKGDPDGSLTGNASDVTVSDPKKGLTIGDLANQVGQNKIAVNFVWTLITGYLVMFMQLGFALLETGLARAKNANHTMMMNMGVYGIGMLANWLIGFAIQMGGVGAVANLGGTAPLSAEFTATVFGKPFGLFGQHGLFLMHKGTYDVGVMVLFLFQMVFMDTGATIPTGAAVERWKFSAFAVTSFLFAAFTYPLFANWAWGGGWLANLGTNFGLGKGYCDFAGSGVVHAVGGLSALAIAMILGPRIGKFSREGRPQVILAHDIVLVIT
ncbi:MAG: ammonium transporter, partial [Acidobacteriota bacterium]|nr:ammonium transporter [Acidobacteriota bacterium]